MTLVLPAVVNGARIMRVQFDATPNDYTDAFLRTQAPSTKRTQRFRRADNLAGILLLAIAAVSSAYVLFFDRVELLWIVGGPIAFCLSLSAPRRLIRFWLRYSFAREFCSNSSIVVQVELYPMGIVVVQNDCYTSNGWTEIIFVQETLDSVDVYTDQGGVIVVRKRAFQSGEPIRQFAEKAQSYVVLAKGTAS
jgi:hypothetical protein